ncbi:MAG: ABC transporter permease [Deltaproteobacteria bacterium]|nr:ABC transporter permease [Deltaproteobacteria bacterium]
MKDLRLFVRDRLSLFWVLAFPLVLALFFGAMFGGGDGERAKMKVVVVDQTGGGATGFLGRLATTDGIEIDTAKSLDDARNLVRRGKRVALVEIRPDFDDGGFSMFGRSDDAAATIAIGVDPSRTAERGMLQGLVTQALFAGLGEQMTNPAQMQAQTKQVRDSLAQATTMTAAQRDSLTSLMNALDGLSLSQGDPGTASVSPMSTEGMVESVDIAHDPSRKPRSSYDVSFPSSIVWGFMGCATAFATNMVRERRAGTLLRLRVSPLTRAHVLAGKGLACFVAGLGASGLLLGFGALALGVRIGDPVLLIMSLLAASACFTGLMMVMSVIGKTEAAVAGGSWIMMMPLAMIGGGMIPLIAMPPWLLTASNFSPFKWAIYGMEGAIWRDFSLAEMLWPLSILLMIAVGAFGLGVWISRRRDP